MVASALTRRQVLKTGAAAGLVAMFGRLPSAYAAGGDDDVEPYLRRATYVPLVGGIFRVAGAALTLDAVGDLEHLPGRDDAFRLAFSGAPGAVEAGTQTFKHPALGSFELFLTPVGAIDGQEQGYEVVIDRSVPLPRRAPAPPSAPAAAAPVAAAAAPAVAAAAPAAPAKKPAVAKKKKAAVKKKKKKAVKKRHVLKRLKHRKRKRRQAKTAS